jgi:hypothetical protein
VTRWLWPQLRLALGAIDTRFRADHLAADDHHYRGHDTHLVGTVGAGVTLRTPARLFETERGRAASLSLGVLLDGGYTFAREATMTATPQGDGDIARTGFALGGLARSGAYARVVMVARF